METKFNFKSQICTSREQSEKLLELGLKKKTADMCYSFDSVITQPFIPSDIFRCIVDTDTENKNTIPAWSLHRLIEMMPSHIDEFQLRSDLVYSVEYENLIGFIRGYLYDNIIDCIEWLIKEGYFNKEYLV